MSTTPMTVPVGHEPEHIGVLPVLVGRIDYVLPARWATTTDAARSQVCSVASMDDALVATVRLLHGADAIVFRDTTIPHLSRVMWLLDGTPDTLTKVSPTDRAPEPGMVEMIGGVSVDDETAQMWASLSGPEGLTARSHMVTLVLQKAQVQPWTLTQCLSARTLGRALWRVFVMAGLGLWWQRAIRQGHTPASARTLLALIADPATLKHVVRWPTDDDPHTRLLVTPRTEGEPFGAPAGVGPRP